MIYVGGLAARVLGWADIVSGSACGQAGAWVHRGWLVSGFNGAGLVPESAVVGLGPSSV